MLVYFPEALRVAGDMAACPCKQLPVHTGHHQVHNYTRTSAILGLPGSLSNPAHLLCWRATAATRVG